MAACRLVNLVKRATGNVTGIVDKYIDARKGMGGGASHSRETLVQGLEILQGLPQANAATVVLSALVHDEVAIELATDGRAEALEVAPTDVRRRGPPDIEQIMRRLIPIGF